MTTPGRSIFVFIAVAILAAAPAASQSVGSASEQSIKAAYLYKLAEYVEWPQSVFGSARAPLVFAVVGADALADELREITHGRAILGRRMVVRNINTQESLDGVHVLFIGTSAMDAMASLSGAAKGNSVLVITESSDGLADGSVINLREMDKRIRFEVSLESADQSRLKLSSRLLAVAARVQPRTK